ncbi:hypothetical protein T05_7559 [Trichinella murrelli]|uniref:Uncharacterized protein n=1 Tax=Trichinella murrelli TaxID=144512 RepID=A0A0V0UCM2_9BILA|nr:hypothetical protein T05_7559 [Trichinella murrelli]
MSPARHNKCISIREAVMLHFSPRKGTEIIQDFCLGAKVTLGIQNLSIRGRSEHESSNVLFNSSQFHDIIHCISQPATNAVGEYRSNTAYAIKRYLQNNHIGKKCSNTNGDSCCHRLLNIEQSKNTTSQTILKSKFTATRIYGERDDHMTVMRLLDLRSQKLSIRKDGTDTKVLDCQEDLETMYCQDLITMDIHDFFARVDILIGMGYFYGFVLDEVKEGHLRNQ